MLNKKIKGFTISELMVTLALTGIITSFAYLGFNYTQKLLKQFNEQNHFISQLNELNKRFTLLSNSANEIIKESDSKYLIKSDSSYCSLEFGVETILMNKTGFVDTFHLKTVNLEFNFEKLNNPAWEAKLVNSLSFNVLFEKEKFRISLNKHYDAYSKLKLETENNN